MAALGLSAGAAAVVHTRLSAVYGWLPGGAGLPHTVDEALGLPRWAAIAAGLVLIALLLGRRAAGGIDARPVVTGLALGAIGVAAWLSGALSGWHWGLSITGPSRSLAELALGYPDAADWGTAMIIGVPLGAWTSARLRGPLIWRRPAWPEIGRRFGGGVLMGIGGTLAAGCNVGNALTGLSVLALNSAIATPAMVAGAALALWLARISAPRARDRRSS